MFSFKTCLLDECILQSNRIDIWQFPLHNVFTQAPTLLNPEEMVLADRYYFPHHRRRFIIARAMLRILLARYLALLPTDIMFSHHHYGKPYLIDFPLLQFNLSHSADLALVAIGHTFPVGIDLEHFSARPYEGIGSHMFSVAENQALCKLPSRLKPLGFFHLWTQKEALIKACGLGLSYPTKQFDLPVLPAEKTSIIDPQCNQQWQITAFMPQVACCAALCHHPTIQEIRYGILPEAKIL